MRKFSLLSILIGGKLFAQSAIDDVFYSNGKIYVVVGVMSIIFIILALYLFRLDRKISKLEKEKNG